MIHKKCSLASELSEDTIVSIYVLNFYPLNLFIGLSILSLFFFIEKTASAIAMHSCETTDSIVSLLLRNNVIAEPVMLLVFNTVAILLLLLVSGMGKILKKLYLNTKYKLGLINSFFSFEFLQTKLRDLSKT